MELSVVKREIEHDSVQAARDAAMDEAAATGGRVFPCTVFRQGSRMMLSTSLPFAVLTRQVRFDPASRGGDPRRTTNRPLMPDHVRTIRDYILENGDSYMLPPVTLNIREIPPVHVARTNMSVRMGYLVLDEAARFFITDGQHRIAAISGVSAPLVKPPIEGVLERDPDFGQHGMSVMIVVEPDLTKIHQDFADAAQTKQIPPSLLAAYNMREPVNRVLAKIVEGSRLLKGRVDETSKTLGKLSQSLFLLNQVRAFVKELLVRNFTMNEEGFTRMASRRLQSPQLQDEFIRETLELLDVLTDNMQPWRRISELPVAGSGADLIPDLRMRYINLTATGLVILGRTAFDIKKAYSGAGRAEKYVSLATKVNWDRDADIWKGNIMQDGKLVIHKANISVAVDKIKESLGIGEAAAE